MYDVLMPALGGAIVLGGTYFFAALIKKYFSLGTFAAASLGFIAALAILIGFVVALDFNDRARFTKYREAEHQAKAKFLKGLCADRRNKGELPGAGCN